MFTSYLSSSAVAAEASLLLRTGDLFCPDEAESGDRCLGSDDWWLWRGLIFHDGSSRPHHRLKAECFFVPPNCCSVCELRGGTSGR